MTTVTRQAVPLKGARSARRGSFVVEAVVEFPPRSSVHSDSMPFRLELHGSGDQRASSLVRLDRPPASPTDVIDGTVEIVSTVAMLLSRWELRARHDDSLVAAEEMPPVGVRPFGPLSGVVRLFGRP